MSQLKLLAVLFALLGGFVSNNAYALFAEGNGSWACEASTGNYICAGAGSPGSMCRWEDFWGNSGVVSRGTSIGHFLGYDCRVMMPNGPFWIPGEQY